MGRPETKNLAICALVMLAGLQLLVWGVRMAHPRPNPTGVAPGGLQRGLRIANKDMNPGGIAGESIVREDGVMKTTNRYTQEVRERAVRMVRDHEREYDSQWAAIKSIAEKIGCTSETLRKWVRQAERDSGKRPGLATEGRERPTLG